MRGVLPNSPQTTIATSFNMPRSSRSVIRAWIALSTMGRSCFMRGKLPSWVSKSLNETLTQRTPASIMRRAMRSFFPALPSSLVVDRLGSLIGKAYFATVLGDSFSRSIAFASLPERMMPTACWVKRSRASIEPEASRDLRDASKLARSLVRSLSKSGVKPSTRLS